MSDSCKKRYVIIPDISLSKGEKGEKGDPGTDAVLVLPLSSDNVDYNGAVLTTVLDQLLYTILQITSFIANTSIYEKGQVLTSIQLSWVYNKAIQAQTITGLNVTPPTLLIADRTKLITLVNVSIDTIITLTADDVVADANPAKTKILTISFFNKLYYGKSVIGTINSAFVLALSNELKATRTKEFTSATGPAEYIWFASPVAYGLPDFKTNGFDGGFLLAATISFTNASGYTENYYVFRSVNENLGVTNIEVL